MSFSGSVSVWIKGVKAGCESAAAKLWERYRKRLLGVARRKLDGELKAVADEEDVAVTAFQSFLCRCRKGGYPGLRDRDELWRLLVTIAVHKAKNQVRDQTCQKRRSVSIPDQSLLPHDFGPIPREFLASEEYSPEMAAMVSDSLQQLLAIFPDGELRQIVLYKIEGCTNDEIASKIGRSLPTVERRLKLIRKKWRRELKD